jgi:hypothetical protein
MIYPDYRKLIVVWSIVVLAIVLVLCSCSPGKKAHDYFAKNEKEFAQDCADAFPVIPVIDSNGFKASLKKIDSLLEDGEAKEWAYRQDREYSEAEVKRLKSKAPPSCDSLYNAQNAVIQKEKKRGDSLFLAVNKIANSAKNIQPIKETKVDNAKVQACEQRESELRSGLTEAAIKLSEVTADRDQWKSTAKKRWWYCFWIIAAFVAITLRKPIFNLLKPIFMKSLFSFLSVCMIFLLASCGHFHDDPKTSVWAGQMWIAFWLPFVGSLVLLRAAIRQQKSGAIKINAGATTNIKARPYKLIELFRFRVFLVLQAFCWGLVIYVNSGWNK